MAKGLYIEQKLLLEFLDRIVRCQQKEGALFMLTKSICR